MSKAIDMTAQMKVERSTADLSSYFGSSDCIRDYKKARKRTDKAIRSMLELILELTDPDNCSFDHNNSCQAHGFYYLPAGAKCPQLEAKQWIAAQTANDSEQALVLGGEDK